jgi:uncharacterized repeat protein (TIGR01451 family)
MSNSHRSIGALAVLAVFSGLATGQQLNCNVGTDSPALRGEGFTEPAGDVTITCIGGVAIAPGNAIPSANFIVFYNTTVTSRLLPTAGNPATSSSEALLLIDEPGSGFPGYGESLPQLLCTTPITGCAATVGAVAGPTFGTAVSSGSTPAPNVYQGIVSGNSVTFNDVPVLPPGAAGTRIFRITNVRVNAGQVSGGAGGPFPVQAFLSTSGSASLLISNSVPIVGYISDGLSASAGDAANFSQCSSQNETSATILTLSEDFDAAFKTRVDAQTNTVFAGQINNPVQNIPGAGHNSESNFVLPINGPQVAGLADFGTRLKATFNNIPSGVRIFVSTANVNNNASPALIPAVIGGSAANANAGGAYVGYALLVNGENTSDANAGVAGVFPAVPATGSGPNNGTVPTAELAVSNGTAAAVWEVVNTNPNTNESFKFAVYVSYTAHVAQNSPSPGTSTVTLTFAPTATSGAASSTLSVPRFSFGSGATFPAFIIQACTNPPVMGVSESHTGNFTQGQNGATYTVTVSNAGGAGPTSGAVTVTETAPSGLSLVSMSGTGWSCTASACTRSDSLASGASYPPITVTVNVAANATSPQINSVSVSGGGSPTATASDSAIVSPATTHPAFFTGEVALANSVYSLQLSDGNPFGYYGYLSSGWIYHFDLGYEYVAPGNGPEVYLWDMSSAHWWYTNTNQFPYLYDFTLNSWIYYFPDTHNAGHYTTNPRYFANMSTNQIFTM